MLGNSRASFIKKFRYLILREPHRFILNLNLKLCLSVIGFINNNFRFLLFHKMSPRIF